MGKLLDGASVAKIVYSIMLTQGYILQNDELQKSKASGLVGLSLSDIVKKYNGYNLRFIKSNRSGNYEIEIRKIQSTLRCIFEDNICVEAYKHTDSDIENENHC